MFILCSVHWVTISSRRLVRFVEKRAFDKLAKNGLELYSRKRKINRESDSISEWRLTDRQPERSSNLVMQGLYKIESTFSARLASLDLTESPEKIVKVDQILWKDKCGSGTKRKICRLASQNEDKRTATTKYLIQGHQNLSSPAPSSLCFCSSAGDTTESSR